MENINYEGFVVTFGESIKEECVNAITKRKETKGSFDENYYAGYITAFYTVFTLMQQQADVFDVPLNKLSIDELTETDFLI